MKTMNIEFHFILILLILMHMDVESKPGPVKSLSSILLFHWNARSVRHKIYPPTTMLYASLRVI